MAVLFAWFLMLPFFFSLSNVPLRILEEKTVAKTGGVQQAYQSYKKERKTIVHLFT
jgi:hypothetical protein